MAQCMFWCHHVTWHLIHMAPIPPLQFSHYQPRSEGDNALGSVRPSVRLSVCLSVLSLLNRLTYDLDFWYGGRPWLWLGWDCRSRSNAKNCALTSLVPCFNVKVGVKVMGKGQKLRSNFWRAAIDIRGSALPSTAKSIRNDCQSEVFVCVSVIRGRIRIIARMRSIGV